MASKEIENKKRLKAGRSPPEGEEQKRRESSGDPKKEATGMEIRGLGKGSGRLIQFGEECSWK